MILIIGFDFCRRKVSAPIKFYHVVFSFWAEFPTRESGLFLLKLGILKMIIIIYQTYENEIMETIIKTRKAFLMTRSVLLNLVRAEKILVWDDSPLC